LHVDGDERCIKSESDSLHQHPPAAYRSAANKTLSDASNEVARISPERVCKSENDP